MTINDIYSRTALEAIPRMLTLQDRNAFSPTYGCFHRDYWLYKTSDFPDAVRQFGCHALALAYHHQLPGNPYHGKAAIADWAIAGLDFWAQIQHSDGSFDEFYPYERGWVGPTAFTTYTSVETYRLLEELMDGETRQRVRTAIERAARFIAAGESEEDHLANHHAMACLAVWKAARLLDQKSLNWSFEKLWQGFLTYHNKEGWSREYDGPDPGYLSATVSFLAKIYKESRERDLLDVLSPAVEFCSYFVYPDGSYGGTIGSRNTQHFYPHGFEILSAEVPEAASVATRMRSALAEGKLVPPGIMSDRYLFYRVPELLLSQIDSSSSRGSLRALPFEREPFHRQFQEAGIEIVKRANLYMVINLRKGGCFKIFDIAEEKLLRSDCGVLGRLNNKRSVTSQWIDRSNKITVGEGVWTVRGKLQKIPSHQAFNLAKNVLFRGVLLGLGWNPAFSHRLKAWIRRKLMTGSRPTKISFEREIRLQPEAIDVKDTVASPSGVSFEDLTFGGDFSIRYVPQSRFFQMAEIDPASRSLLYHPHSHQRTFRLKRRIDCRGERVLVSSGLEEEGTGGVYGEGYFQGRQNKRQLAYRLRRRTAEVEQSLRNHGNGLRRILDVGTADGLMADMLAERMPGVSCFGIDRSRSLLAAVSNGRSIRVQGDARSLPVGAESFDAVVACAVVEHLSNPRGLFRESHRVLRNGGILVLTSPTPHMERLASRLGILRESGHQSSLSIDELEILSGENGLQVVERKRFMFSPVGFPAERILEKTFGPVGMKWVMANQLLVARKHEQRSRS